MNYVVPRKAQCIVELGLIVKKLLAQAVKGQFWRFNALEAKVAYFKPYKKLPSKKQAFIISLVFREGSIFIIILQFVFR